MAGRERWSDQERRESDRGRVMERTGEGGEWQGRVMERTGEWESGSGRAMERAEEGGE